MSMARTSAVSQAAAGRGQEDAQRAERQAADMPESGGTGRVWQRARGKVQASVARYLRTPPYAAKRKGLVSVLELLTQPEPSEHGCHWQLYFWTDNGGTSPSESWPL